MLLNAKIREIAREKREKEHGYKEKYTMGLDRLDQIKVQEKEYMTIRKDNNLFRVLDQKENAKKLSRRQSAYKRHLIDKLVEK